MIPISISKRGTGNEPMMTQQDLHDWNRRIIEEFRTHGGQVRQEFGSAPLLLLNTTGAKSGKPFTHPLLYLADQERLFIFAAKNGTPTNPDWYYNLLAHPQVVELGTERFQATAVVLEGEGRDWIYAKQVERMPGFAEYQKKTSRQIPVIELIQRP
jgi:deazaflavin-dependent oxidoreductase (nitroreductase family)